MPKWRIGIILWVCNLSQEKTQCEISIYDCNCLKFLFTEMTNYSPDSSVPLKEKLFNAVLETFQVSPQDMTK